MGVSRSWQKRCPWKLGVVLSGMVKRSAAREAVIYRGREPGYPGPPARIRYPGFFAQYLSERFGEDWSLSPEQSLKLHAGDTTVPVQLLVRAPNAGNKRTDFPYNTSIFETRATLAQGDELVVKEGLRLFSVEEALTLVPERFFKAQRDGRTDASGVNAGRIRALGPTSRRRTYTRRRAVGRGVSQHRKSSHR